MYIDFADIDEGYEALAEKKFTIAIHDLDMNYSSTLPIIGNFFYDVGIVHGPVVFKDTGIMNKDVVFVLKKFRLMIDRYPALRESFTVRSWISPVDHKYAIRNYHLLDESGNIFGRAIYATAAFNLKERVGVDISKNANISKAKTLNVEPALPIVFENLSNVDSPDYESNIDVRYFDCDFFRHVTHVKYMEWCIESMPVEFLRKHRLYEMELNFKSESSIGERLIVKTCAASAKNTFLHSITGEDGRRDIVRMKSVWKSSN